MRCTWTADELRRIGDARELHVATQRPDGTLRNPIPIWHVRAGDAIYIRSAHGLVSPRQGVGTGRIQSGGVQRDVAFEPVSADLADEITVTYHAKYDRYGPAPVDSDTRVDVNTGIVAAGRLQSLIDSRDYSHDLLVIKVQMDQICDAVKSTVPQEMWGETIEKLEELEHHPEAPDVGTDSFNDADDEPFDPTEFIDEDDEF